MSTFTEVADRTWVMRREWLDTNVSVIGGEQGLVVVDTHGSAAAGHEVLTAVRALGTGEVRAVVNTHWHFDHTFGNSAFTEAYPAAPIWAHEAAAEELSRDADLALKVLGAPGHPDSEGHHTDIATTRVAHPTHTFSSVKLLDLGDRAVELLHLGRGHTAGDIVVRVSDHRDADVLIAGDLVEESGAPCLGDDSYPLDWPLTLDLVLGLLTPHTVVVPGHGACVDRDFVERQRGLLGVIAETARDLAGRGIPQSQALDVGEWPLPREVLTHAIARAYEHLPNSQKRLPLV